MKYSKPDLAQIVLKQVMQKGVCFPHRNFASSTAEMQYSDFVTPSSRKEHMSRAFGIENSICYVYSHCDTQNIDVYFN